MIYVGFDPLGPRRSRQRRRRRRQQRQRRRSDRLSQFRSEMPNPAQRDTAPLSARMSAITVGRAGRRQMRAEIERGMTAADKTDRRHAGRDRGRHAGGRILDHDAIVRRDAGARARHAGTDRAPACRPSRRSPRTRCGSKKRSRSVHSRLARTRSSGDDEATHFGPRSQVSACTTCGIARSSSRSRRSVAAATCDAKSCGQLDAGRLPRHRRTCRPAGGR